MLPIRDNIPTSSTPYFTIGLIILNCLVFLFEKTGDMQQMTWKYGYVPAKLVDGQDEFADRLRERPPLKLVTDRFGRPQFADPWGRRVLVEPDRAAMSAAVALPAWLTLFTCMFLHGGWMHLLGNMLYLWIFGNNIEDRLGLLLFLVFYLGTGIVGSLTHTLFDSGVVPLVGASGAISGVMGAYILLFPRSRITGIIPIGWYPLTVNLPAWIFLGFYFLVQNLYAEFFTAMHSAAGSDGVARWAHIGGFVSGAALIYIFPHRKPPAAAQRVDGPRDDDADLVI